VAGVSYAPLSSAPLVIIIFFTIGSIDPIIIIIIIIIIFLFFLFCFFNPRKNEGGKKIKKSRKRFEVEN